MRKAFKTGLAGKGICLPCSWVSADLWWLDFTNSMTVSPTTQKPRDGSAINSKSSQAGRGDHSHSDTERKAWAAGSWELEVLSSSLLQAVSSGSIVPTRSSLCPFGLIHKPLDAVLFPNHQSLGRIWEVGVSLT